MCVCVDTLHKGSGTREAWATVRQSREGADMYGGSKNEAGGRRDSVQGKGIEREQTGDRRGKQAQERGRKWAVL